MRIKMNETIPVDVELTLDIDLTDGAIESIYDHYSNNSNITVDYDIFVTIMKSKELLSNALKCPRSPIELWTKKAFIEYMWYAGYRDRFDDCYKWDEITQREIEIDDETVMVEIF